MTSEDRLIKVGPAYRSSSHSQDFDLKGCKISQIFISAAEDGIKSIQFQYVENGKYVLSDQYGHQYGHAYSTNRFHTIELNHPTEYITGVNGINGDISDNIKVITFITNIQEYGPFGTSPNSRYVNPRSFTYSLGKSCQIGGLHGTYNYSGLLSIGLYLRVKTEQPSLGSKIPKKEP